MAEPARRTRPETITSPPNFSALMRQAETSGQIGVKAVMATRPDSGAWLDLELKINRLLADRQPLAGTRQLDEINQAIVAATSAVLQRHGDGRPRAQAFETFVDELEEASDHWDSLVPPRVVAAHIHAVLMWYCAWHMLSAGLPVDEVLTILLAKAPAPRSASPEPHPEDRIPSVCTADTHSAGAFVSQGVERASTLAGTAVAKLKALLETARSAHVQRAAAAKELRDERRTKAAQEAHVALASGVAGQQISSTTEGTNSPMLALNGRALRGSVFGTWLLLVVMSWVSLIWGALLSAPFGVGIALMVTAGAGIFVVPLFGTVFGFLGMGVARDSTLRTMGFKELPKDDAVRELAAEYCKALDIPVPQLGTIAAHNAFAMGLSQNDATVALGRPLIASLTPQETAAVLAHELGHVVSGDMRKMMLMRTFQNATVWFAMFQGVKQFARWVICWAAELCILAFSRKREYWADAIAAALAGKEAMIGALRKLEQGPALTPEEKTHARFMVRGKPFSTHPSTADRIKALEEETYIRKLPVRR